AASALLLLAVLWMEERGRSRRLWQLAIVAPIALAGSLTAVFVVGALGLAMAPIVWNERSRRIWIGYLGFGAASVSTFLILYHVHLSTAGREWRRTDHLIPSWSDAFPPLSEGVFATLGWLVTIHAGNLLSYPIGGDVGGSTVTLVCVIAGLVALVC